MTSCGNGSTRTGKALHDLRAVSDTLGVMNRKLKESEALKSNFLANIRNEINNPLTAILGLAKVLTDRLDGDDEPALVAGMIYAEAFDFHFQIRNILIAASLEAGESLPFYARTDMCRLALMTIDSSSDLTLKKGVKVVLPAGSHLRRRSAGCTVMRRNPDDPGKPLGKRHRIQPRQRSDRRRALLHGG